MVEEARELRTYDKAGHIVRHVHQKPDGSMVVEIGYAWDAVGRMTSHTYKDHTKRVERRDYTYKVDANGRVVERIMRNPASPAGEYYRDDIQWGAAGGRSVTTYRHHATGGPYPDGSKIYDAKGRLSRSCFGSGGCSMYEYDTHGNVDRIREQNRDRHHYRDHESTYDSAGKLTKQIVGDTQSEFTWNTRGDVSEIFERAIASQGGTLRAKTVYVYSYR